MEINYVKQIPLGGKLGNGKFALVDDGDYPLVKDLAWHIAAKKYAGSTWNDNGHRGVIYMHRLIAQPGDSLVVDHINGDGLDNRRVNLRICVQAKNVINRRVIRSQSGYRGVSYLKDRNAWTARLDLNGRRHYLGYFKTK